MPKSQPARMGGRPLPGEKNPPCCSKHIWEEVESSRQPGFPRGLSHIQCRHRHWHRHGTGMARHGPAAPPAPGRPTQPSCKAAPAFGVLWALYLANKRYSPGNHRKLHPPNLTLLHKSNCSHVKARAAGERASCFGASQAHAVSGQKSKAHMERKGKSIHSFRLFTVHSRATQCPQRAERGMAAGRGSPSTATQPPRNRRDAEDPKKMDTRCSCLHLPGKLSMVLCHGLCIGEGLCIWETPGAQP